MTPVEFMNKTFPDWEWRRVRLLSLPLPPIAIRGLIYRADAFGSRTFDHAFDLGDNVYGPETSTYRTLGIKPTKNGPAILISIKLGEIIGFNTDNGFLTIKRKAVCATVTYQTKYQLRIPGTNHLLDYADNANIERLNFSASCNPGSHLVVPGAPHLSAILQYAASPQGEAAHIVSDRVTYLTPEEGVAAFPGFDFSSNGVIDSYIARCPISPLVKYNNEGHGIGEWTAPILSAMRQNRFKLQGEQDGERTVPGIIAAG